MRILKTTAAKVNKCADRCGALFFCNIYFIYVTQGGHNFRKLVIFSGIRSEENAFAGGPDPRRTYREYFNIPRPLVAHSPSLSIKNCVYIRVLDCNIISIRSIY